MHYNLLFNGCSYTFGGELEGLDNDLEYRRTHRFSHLVANHFGMTYDNISECGVSNDWIVEKIIDWFEEGNTCDITVIQFSEVLRTIWYKNEVPHSVTSFIHPDAHKKNIELSLAQREYYKTFYSDILGIQNFYKNLFFITNYLKSKNINYILLCLEHKEIIEKVDNHYGWKRHCKNEKFKYIMEIIGIFNNYRQHDIKNKNYCPDLSQHYRQDKKYTYLMGAHPSEIGHQKIADYIVSEIEVMVD